MNPSRKKIARKKHPCGPENGAPAAPAAQAMSQARTTTSRPIVAFSLEELQVIEAYLKAELDEILTRPSPRHRKKCTNRVDTETVPERGVDSRQV